MKPTKEQKAEHTPGPWEVRDRWYISRPGKMALAEVKCGDVPFEATEIHEANARLIAAAPDLLEALKEALPYVQNAYEFSFPDFKETEAIEERIIAALKKAGAQ
jgi:hypothetical protein